MSRRPPLRNDPQPEITEAVLDAWGLAVLTAQARGRCLDGECTAAVPIGIRCMSCKMHDEAAEALSAAFRLPKWLDITLLDMPEPPWPQGGGQEFQRRAWRQAWDWRQRLERAARERGGG